MNLRLTILHYTGKILGIAFKINDCEYGSSTPSAISSDSPMKYEYFRSNKNQQWYWRLKAANHEIIASGEGYKNKADVQHVISLLKTSDIALVEEELGTD